MKTFLNVCLWLMLAACVVALFAVNGRENALRDDVRTAQRRYDALQTLYDQTKQQLTDAREGAEADEKEWREVRSALEMENAALKEALEQVQLDLSAQRSAADSAAADRESQWAAERNAWAQERAALTEDRDGLADRLSQVTSLLLPSDTPAPDQDLFLQAE